jgi:hypothetical protein
MHDGHPSESGLLRRLVASTKQSHLPSPSTAVCYMPRDSPFKKQFSFTTQFLQSQGIRPSSLTPVSATWQRLFVLGDFRSCAYVANSGEKKSLHHGFLGNISCEAAMSGPPALHSNGDLSRLCHSQSHISCRGSILLKSALKRRAVILEISDKPAFGLLVVPDQLQVDVHLAKHRLHCE